MSHYALWRLDSDSFMVIVPGPVLPFLYGHSTDYYLLDKKYEDSLKHLAEQVSIHPVSIWDKAKQETLTNYMELKIKYRFPLGSYEQQPWHGLDIWLYEDILMLSDNLKKIWQNFSGDALVFDDKPPLFA